MHTRELRGTHTTRRKPAAVIKLLFFEDQIAVEVKARGNAAAVHIYVYYINAFVSIGNVR